MIKKMLQKATTFTVISIFLFNIILPDLSLAETIFSKTPSSTLRPQAFLNVKGNSVQTSGQQENKYKKLHKASNAGTQPKKEKAVPDKDLSSNPKKNSNIMKKAKKLFLDNYIFLASLGIGALFGLVEIFVYFIFSKNTNLFQMIFSPGIHDIIGRGLILAACGACGIFYQKNIKLHKKNEKIKSKTEQKYRLLADNVRDVIWVLDPKTMRFTYVSPSSIESSGYTDKETLKHDLSDMMPKDSLEAVYRALAEEIDKHNSGIKGAGNRTLELKQYRKNGTIYWIEIITSFILDDNNSIVSILGVSRDITDRIHAREESQASEKRFRTLYKASPDGVLILEITEEDGGGIKLGDFIYSNPAILQMLGYTEKEFMKMSVIDIHPKEHLEYVRSKLMSQIKQEKTMATDIICLRKDKTTFYADFNTVKCVINGKNCVIGFFRDITERKQTEGALREEKYFRDILFGTAQAIILVLDTNGRIIDFNPYMEEISGYSLEEMKGKEWFNTFLPEHNQDKVKQLFSKAIKDRQTKGYINEIVTKAGKEVSIEWYDKALKNDDGNIIGILAIGHDVTARIQAEKAMIKSEKLATMGTAIFGVAHEFNNPLAIIIGFVEQANQALQSKNYANLEFHIENIIEPLHRLNNIVRNLLISIHKKDLKKEVFPISDAIEETIRDYDTLIRSSNTIVHKNIGSGLLVNANKGELTEVFSNLIKNSIDAMEGLVDKQLSITAEKIKDHDKIRIRIADNGKGAPEEEVEKWFEHFYTTKDVGKGTGLGLPIVKGLVEAFEGTIQARSKPDKGTSFEIIFPLAKALKSDTKKDTLTNILSQPSTYNIKKILVIDDEKGLLELYRTILSGYEIVTAENGKQALEVINQKQHLDKPFDLIIVDFSMPVMDGSHFALEFRKQEQEKIFKREKTLVVMVTGYAADIVDFDGQSGYPPADELWNIGVLDWVLPKKVSQEPLIMMCEKLKRIPEIKPVEKEALFKKIEQIFSITESKETLLTRLSENNEPTKDASITQTLNEFKIIRKLLHDINNKYTYIISGFDIMEVNVSPAQTEAFQQKAIGILDKTVRKIQGYIPKAETEEELAAFESDKPFKETIDNARADFAKLKTYHDELKDDLDAIAGIPKKTTDMVQKGIEGSNSLIESYLFKAKSSSAGQIKELSLSNVLKNQQTEIKPFVSITLTRKTERAAKVAYAILTAA